MTRTELENGIMEVMKNFDDSEMVDVWNGYVQANRMFDDEIMPMSSFDYFYESYTPEEIATRCFYGHDEWNDESSFNPNREWFYLNGYGNPVSIDYIGWNEYGNKFMCPFIDANAIIDYIIETGDDLDCYDISELLDEFNESGEK